MGDHKLEQFTPSFSPERTQVLSDRDLARLAHLQEEETGPERGSDGPWVTQLVCLSLQARTFAPEVEPGSVLNFWKVL